MKGESVTLIDEAMAKDRMIGLLVAQKKENLKPDPESGDLATVGTAALILKMAKTEDNHVQLLVQGLSRFRVKAFEKASLTWWPRWKPLATPTTTTTKPRP